jgi:flavorubredoxin
MTVQLTDEVYWLNYCEALDHHEGLHTHHSVFLIKGESDILVDTGPHIQREAVVEEVEGMTDGDGPDDIIITHSDNPHAGNAVGFAVDWNAEIHAAVAAPNAQGLLPEGKGTRKLVLGKNHEINGRPIRSTHLVLVDRQNATGIFDYGSGVYFTADGFGNYHVPGECESFFDGVDNKLERITAFQKEKLPWLRYVHGAQIKEGLRESFSNFDLSFIAGSHGNPIPVAQLDEYLNFFEESVDDIYVEYEGPGSLNPAARPPET